MNIDQEHLLAALRRARDPRGMKPHEVTAALGADEKARHRVRALLAELLDAGTLEKAEGGRYRPLGWVPAPGPLPAPTLAPIQEAPPGTIAGSIRVHPAGYGFVVRDDHEDDVFVPARHRGGALDGDRVALSTWLGYKGTEGRVVAVLARGRARLTGTLLAGRKQASLTPDDPRIHGEVAILGELEALVAADGQVIVAEIVHYPVGPDEPFTARLLKVLGPAGDPATEIAKIIACADIPDEFSDEVQEAARRAPAQVEWDGSPLRADLRHLPFLTIDPDNARDYDDAVCVEEAADAATSVRLWVAVADVSHYVREGSAIDHEAQRRGVSVYLPNRAIPMLPEQLSSNICSLLPEVDRFAMVVRIDVASSGEVADAEMMAAVIRSRARLDYGGVAAALSGDLAGRTGKAARYEPHLPQLRRMQALAERLRRVRDARGSLDFDVPEAVVRLDEDDPKRVRSVSRSRSDPRVRGAYRLVEDFMLAANEAVARRFRQRGLDTLWRVHDVPKESRLEEFAQIAASFGVAFSADDGRSPKKLRAFLASIEGKPMQRALSYLLLRSLKQAAYDVVNVGHFGLAAPDYLHFTSPIRRYPDLVVHRLLKRDLAARGQPAGEVPRGPTPAREQLEAFARTSSSHERRAMEAEREVVDLYRAIFMRDHVGEEFDGLVAGVAAFGLFIEIDEPFVEGLIKIERLPGHSWSFDDRAMRLVSRSGESFALGDAVRVRIEDASIARRKIDLALVGHEETAPRAPGGRPAGRHEKKPARSERSTTPRRRRERAGPGGGKRR